jgi:hypothetical protein
MIGADDWQESLISTYKLPIHVSHTGYWGEGIDVDAISNRYGSKLQSLSYHIDSFSISSPSYVDLTIESNKSSVDDDGSVLSTEHETTELVNEEMTGIWGMGLWGVWETCSGSPHFELQKGGVYRAIPIL